MSRYVRPSGDAPEYTDALKAQVERLTAELAHMQTMQKVDQRVFEKLRETQDLAEHWAILAEQRRVELGECRKDAERYRWLRSKDVGPAQIWECIQDDCNPPYWMLKFESELDAAIDAAMEAKP